MATPAASSPVNFTASAAARIVDAVRIVEAMPTSTPAGRNAVAAPGAPFWAYLSSAGGANGLFWSWVRVQPIPPNQQPTANDPYTVDNVPLFTMTSPPVAGFQNAREVNGNRDIPTGSLARLEFIGYDANKQPLYVFQYVQTHFDAALPVHNHGSNSPGDGGFAWATYHPGTSLPQQNFGI